MQEDENDKNHNNVNTNTNTNDKNNNNNNKDQTNERRRRPNFIFFFPDTIRAESLNVYGNKVPNVTPNFDQFATSDGSTLFEQAHVMHTQCSPSRATMVTGRYIHVLGHRTQTHLIQAYEHNYFRLLRNSGYDIQWFGKNDVFSVTSFNKSVSYWTSGIGYDSGVNAFPVNVSGHYSFLYTGGEQFGNDTKYSGDYKALLSAIDYLHNQPKEPFVIFLPTRGAHPPYGAPKDFSNQWTLQQIKENVQLRSPKETFNKPRYHSRTNGIPHYRNLTYLTDDTFYEIQKKYLEMISYTDWQFGILLDQLKESGYESNTIVLFSSDHGDFAGDYGLVEKWPGAADDVLTRVPLAIRVPPQMKSKLAQQQQQQQRHNGKKNVSSSLQQNRSFISKAPVQIADIMETMIDLAGIKSDFIRFAISLVPQIIHNEEGDLNRYVYSEGGFSFDFEIYPNGSDHLPENNTNSMYWPRAYEEMIEGSPKWIMIRNLTSKLVYRPMGISELYDLQNDPKEMINLYGNELYSDLQHDLMNQLLVWLVQTSDVPPLIQDPRETPEFPSEITEKSCVEAMEPYYDDTTQYGKKLVKDDEMTPALNS